MNHVWSRRQGAISVPKKELMAQMHGHDGLRGSVHKKERKSMEYADRQVELKGPRCCLVVVDSRDSWDGEDCR